MFLYYVENITKPEKIKLDKIDHKRKGWFEMENPKAIRLSRALYRHLKYKIKKATNSTH